MTKEQIKTQIEILREGGLEEKRLIRDNLLFSDIAFDTITSSMHTVGYNLLNQIIHIPDRIEEQAYKEFEDYMYGISYGNIDQLLNGIEKIKLEE